METTKVEQNKEQIVRQHKPQQNRKAIQWSTEKEQKDK
jgi:hypothetical protein